MATPRSYARIVWRKKRLGLSIVNTYLQRDFIFAYIVIELCNRPGVNLLVKHRDKEPDRAIGYHAGEIWGAYRESDKASKITLYLWPIGQIPSVDSATGEPIDCMVHEYLFPRDEFRSFLAVLTYMHNQREKFDDLQTSFATTPMVFLSE